MHFWIKSFRRVPLQFKGELFTDLKGVDNFVGLESDTQLKFIAIHLQLGKKSKKLILPFLVSTQIDVTQRHIDF